MMVDETLHMAAQSGLDAVDHALAAGHSNFEETDAEEGFTPLQWAASAGYSDVCDRLIRKGAHPDYTDDADEWTALHHAAMGGHHETVAQLLRSKANPFFVCNNMGTALHRACEQGHAEIVLCLLEADLDVNAVDGDMDSPLHLAACGLDLKGHPEIVESLLKHGANPHLTNKPKRLASKVTKNGEIRKQLQQAEDEWQAAGKPTRRDDIVRQHQPDRRTQEELRVQIANKEKKKSVSVDQENIDPQQRDKKRPAKKAAAKAPAPKRTKAPAAAAKPNATAAPKRQAEKCATKKVQPKKSNKKQVRPVTTPKEQAPDDTEMVFELEAADSPVQAHQLPSRSPAQAQKPRHPQKLVPPASAAKHLNAELQKEDRKRNEAAAKAAKAALLNDNEVQEERRKRDEAAEKRLLLEDSKARQREAARADAARAVAESAAAAAPSDSWYSGCILSQEQQAALSKEAAAKSTADKALAESAEKHLAWENATTSEEGRIELVSKCVFRALTEVESISLEQLKDQINSEPQANAVLFSLDEVKTAVTGHADRGTMFFDESDNIVYSLKN